MPKLYRVLISLIVTVVLVSSLSAQAGCGGPATPPVPLTPLPPGAPMELWVDPVHGNDLQAAFGVAPFKTIKAASTVLSFILNAQVYGSHGVIRLMPGRYGYDPLDPKINGERWPVIMRPGVSLRGVSASNVMLDGSALYPNTTPFTVPDVRTGLASPVVPILVFQGPVAPQSFEHSLISRVAFVRAQLGVLVQGGLSVSPTLAQCLFTGCATGAQIHSLQAAAGAPSPRFLHCTFGNNVTGLAATGDLTAGPTWTGTALPAVVNCLFKNDHDLEGIACAGVQNCAFAPATSNGSPAVGQPSAAPQALFDTGLYTHGDLFIGGKYIPPAAMASSHFFTDWRLTFRTQTFPVVPNPAIGTAHSIFPLSLENGTIASLAFPGEMVGTQGGEGNGTQGPLGPFSGGSGWDLGYDPAGSFVIGGTMPLTNAFGTAYNGVLYNTLDFYLDPFGSLPFLWVNWVSAPFHVPGQAAPRGIVNAGASGLLAGVQGALVLDPALQIENMTSFLTPAIGGTENQFSLTIPPSTGITEPMGLAAQFLFQTEGGMLAFSNPQVVYFLP